MHSNWGRTGLIGDTGFVGTALASQIAFDETYNSRTIERISGKRFDTLICAGAPATMWTANANPSSDRRNLQHLAECLSAAKVGRLLLISTIAVFDDSAAGYTENNARYETIKGYGRNRRDLETECQAMHKTTVMRLPALFGAGLKKNFIFDIVNPIPSFLKRETLAAIREAFSAGDAALLDRAFSFDDATDMQKLDRVGLKASGDLKTLQDAFERIGILARNFTNSDSAYQYYNLMNLARDIDTSLASSLPAINICSEPWRAGDLYAALTGASFENKAVGMVTEDVRTEYAGLFGRTGPYLYSRDEILRDLTAFVRAEAT
jgi:hypothetical protein